MFRFPAFLALLVLTSLARAGDIQQLLQLIDYVGVDYAEAVTDGVVVNPAEYEEMVDFTSGIEQQAAALPTGESRDRLQQQAAELAGLIAAKASPADIRGLTAAMRLAVIDGYKVAVVPRKPPDLARGALLYSEQCASCHGATGGSDGALAAGMEPPPINFRDHERYSQRTLYGLYNTTTQGVADTAMGAYHELPAADRWALAFSRHRLDDVLAAYHKEEYTHAYQLAVEAYLEGFELVEQGLNAVDAGLRLEIEQAMTGLRTRIRKRVSSADLERDVVAIKASLDLAQERLDGRSLSGTAAFASAFFILLREGLEALLVVAALAAFLVKTGHRSSMKYLHIGWVGALAAGFLTWWASVSLIEISGAGREITEGVAALLATAVLFYVGFWLHDKTNAAQWERFIETNIQRALSTGTLWGLAGLSFIAVYREVFETILFYQALWAQTDTAGRTMALSGFGVGVGVLAVLALLVMRYSARLPLRQFFSATGILMFVLALIFAGKGVAALQEAGYIPVTPVSFPRIDLLGIYPNMQGLLLQLALLLLALFLWYGLPGKRRSAAV